MIRIIRTFFFSLTLVAFFLFSTVGTITAYADDDPPPATSETAAPPEQEEATDTEEESAPTTEEESTSITEEEPVSITEEEAASVTETGPILEQVPENTTITVVDSEGVAQPLASQASADAITAATDPIWCPATQTTPTPGQNGCTESFTSFTDLLTFLQNNEGDPAYQQSGTIYIEQGAYAGGEPAIDFNDYTFTQFNNHDLTLQGGWDPSDNSVDGTSQFTTPIIIGSSLNPWGGSLTINNISINGVTDQAGLTLFTQDGITLSNVEVTGSQSGAELTAGSDVGDDVNVNDSDLSGNQNAGLTINGGYNVSVVNGNFNNNGSGVNIQTSGQVSLVNVVAQGNLSNGVQIAAGDVSIDTSLFSNNGSSGLSATSQNDIALVGVVANNNQQHGANIFAGNLVAIAQSDFNGNGGHGLSVVTTGLIALNQVNANDNELFGAYIEGDDTVISNSFFTANGSLGVVSEPVGYGLRVVSTGTVNLNNINSADSIANQLFGADITAADNVNITSAFFSGHQSEIFIVCEDTTEYYGYGLRVVTPDDIFLDQVVANYNNLWGADLTGRDVTVYNSQFNNNVTDSTLFIDDTGLLVNAAGLVDIFNVEAMENRLIGAVINAGGDVYVTDSNFSDNRGVTCNDDACEDFNTYGYGLNVVTTGNIYVTGVTANDNFLFGASLTGANVEVSNSTFNSNGSCIVRPAFQTPIVECIDPNGQGLIVNSSGDTLLSNVTASNNERFGVKVQASGNVVVTNGLFSGNQSFTYFDDGDFDTNGYGIQVVANGDINLSNVEANENGEDGGILVGQSTITVSDSVFNFNGHSGGNNGLTIIATAGNVTLNNVSASNNQGQDGVNVTGACGLSVFVNGGNFSNNDRNGLKIKLSTLVLDGTQIIADNGSDNIFTTSSTCPPVAPPPADNDETNSDTPVEENNDTTTTNANNTTTNNTTPGTDASVGTNGTTVSGDNSHGVDKRFEKKNHSGSSYVKKGMPGGKVGIGKNFSHKWKWVVRNILHSSKKVTTLPQVQAR